MKEYLLGLDIGSSSIKAGLVDAASGEALAVAQSPEQELPISAPKSGWAEQHPDTWWEHVKRALDTLFAQGFDRYNVKAIGISYQMHGLVAVDHQGKPLRPAIIWCDSRAASIGETAFHEMGEASALGNLLNSPGNFTAAKLAWVKTHEAELYDQIDKIMLPGDYIAAKLSGDICTTISGLSEGIFWDFRKHTVSSEVLEAFDLREELIPPIISSFGDQVKLSKSAAIETGLPSGIPISYRAGDQPNNAVSLNVFEPGQLAATAGTSGVVYGILDQLNHDTKSRVNLFAHVNHLPDLTRLGVLLCINGCGIQYSWLKNQLLGGRTSYAEMNDLATQVAPGSDGLQVYPFGNGIERVLHNKPFGGQFRNLDFNRHQVNHLIRAAKEGIVFALNYGFEAMREMGVKTEVVRAGSANLFLSPLFAQIFATLTQARVELYDTDGAIGAARASGIGSGHFQSVAEAFDALSIVKTINPEESLYERYSEYYQLWKNQLQE